MDQPIRRLFYLNRGLIAVIAGDPAKMYVSLNGATWTAHSYEGLESAKVSNAGDQYLLDTGKEIFLSADGARWEKADMGSADLSLRSIAYDGKTYVSAGGRGTVFGGEGNRTEPYRVIGTSSNLRNWKVIRSENTSALNSVVWAKGRFVAVGDSGTIFTSTDGVSGWKQMDSATNYDLNCIVWDGTRFIAAGDNGTILYSADGINWTKVNSITSDPIDEIVVHGKQYIAIGALTILKGTLTETPADSFSDVGSHWARPYINDLARRKLINGVGGTAFAPDRDITRAEFAAILTRALNLQASGKQVPFRDIMTTDWYYESISAAYENGIIKGYESGTVKPGSSITREEAMAMIARVLMLKGQSIELSESVVADTLGTFRDGNRISSWAKVPASVCILKGIIEGNNGIVEPGDEITRAETAAIVLRMLNQL